MSTENTLSSPEYIDTTLPLGIVAQAISNEPDVIFLTRDTDNNITQTEVIYPEAAYVQQFLNPPISE